MGQQLLAFFVHSRQQASTPSTVQSTVVASPLHPTTREEAPKQCLVLRGGWAACGTTSGTTSKRRPAVKSSPCLETAPQDPAALVGQQLQALYIAHSRQQASTLSTVQSAGQHAGTPGPPTGLFFLYFQIRWAASWNVQGHQQGRKRPNYVWS